MSETIAFAPIETLKVGDRIVGPWGRYELLVTKLTDTHVFGLYTKVPPNGYQLGETCCYQKKDWTYESNGQFVFAE